MEMEYARGYRIFPRAIGSCCDEVLNKDQSISWIHRWSKGSHSTDDLRQSKKLLKLCIKLNYLEDAPTKNLRKNIREKRRSICREWNFNRPKLLSRFSLINPSLRFKRDPEKSFSESTVSPPDVEIRRDFSDSSRQAIVLSVIFETRNQPARFDTGARILAFHTIHPVYTKSWILSCPSMNVSVSVPPTRDTLYFDDGVLRVLSQKPPPLNGRFVIAFPRLLLAGDESSSELRRVSI